MANKRTDSPLEPKYGQPRQVDPLYGDFTRYGASIGYRRPGYGGPESGGGRAPRLPMIPYADDDPWKLHSVQPAPVHIRVKNGIRCIVDPSDLNLI